MARSSRVISLLGSLILGLSLLVAGCGEQESPTSVDGTGFRPQASPERQTLTDVTHLVALALGDEGLRQRVKNDMRLSPFLEHKLEFASYLRGESGGILLAKMVQHSGLAKADILALVGQIRPLEFYMPVAEHRTTWTGGPEVIVASLLEDHTIPTGFSTSGEPYQFTSAEDPPPVPVLAIVPVETDFSSPLLPGLYENTQDANGGAIGIYRRLGSGFQGFEICNTECGGGGGGGTTPSGLHMTFSWIPNDYEGFLKGNPEFETHLQAPTTSPSTAEDIRCAGEHAPDLNSRYDQNNKFWSGKVLLASQQEMDNFRATFGQSVGMNFVVWEDDDTACVIKADQNRFQSMLEAIAAAYGAVDAAIQDLAVRTIVLALSAVRNAVFALASWLKSNDDVVGSSVGVQCTAPDGTTTNFSIKDGTTTTGCVRFVAE